MIEQKIYQTLSSHAGTHALVATRTYPVVLPQGVEFPALTYQVTSEDPENTLDGYSGLSAYRVQIDCWSEGYMESKTLAAEVRAAMEESTLFESLRGTCRDLYESTTHLHRHLLDFEVWANE